MATDMSDSIFEDFLGSAFHAPDGELVYFPAIHLEEVLALLERVAAGRNLATPCGHLEQFRSSTVRIQAAVEDACSGFLDVAEDCCSRTVAKEYASGAVLPVDDT